MSTDKRKVSTDALDTLGTILSGEDLKAGRDAIHLAVEPVYAAETLYPGQHVGLIPSQDSRFIASPKAKKLLGIVDPFIDGCIPAGNKFWLVVYPRTITSLRHVWSHPDFPEDNDTIKK